MKTDHSNMVSSRGVVRTQLFFGKYLAWCLIYSMPLERTVSGLHFFLWQIPEFTEWRSMAHCLYPSVRRKGRQALQESSGNPIDDTWEVDFVFYRSEATGSGGNISKCSSVRNKSFLYTSFFYINTLKIMLLHVITIQKHANLKGKQKKMSFSDLMYLFGCVHIFFSCENDYLCLYYICTFPLHRYCGNSKNTRFCHIEKTVNMSF